MKDTTFLNRLVRSVRELKPGYGTDHEHCPEAAGPSDSTHIFSFHKHLFCWAPKGRVGTWWLPGTENAHYELWIILHSIKRVITARCCGDGHTTPYNNRNYDPGVSLAQHTLNFSQKKFGRIAY